jgi:hypothetical protein
VRSLSRRSPGLARSQIRVSINPGGGDLAGEWVLRMQTPNPQQSGLAGLGRGLRAAIVVPSLFALGLLVIKQPQMAGFSVFGTFAHLVMVNYAAPRRTRAAQAAILTFSGAILVTLGTLASVSTWLAAAGAFSAGFLSKWPAFLRGYIPVIRTALLLSFMLAVGVPTPPRYLLPQLAGWFLAGLVAQPVLQFLWIPILPTNFETEPLAANSSMVGSSRWLADAICTGAALGLAVLVARLLHLAHAFWVVLGVLPVLGARGASRTRTFWQQQAATALGFLVGAILVAIAGANQACYWIILPCIIFFSAYASSALGFIEGQAGFTVFAVVLFCILSPLQRQVGLLRVEDVAIGGIVSLLVASLQRFGETYAPQPFSRPP